MEFWYFFYFMVACFGFWDLFNNKKNALHIFIFIIWFVGSFRYMIGTDYSSYMGLYLNANLDDLMSLRMEPIFYSLMLVLKGMGFAPQVFFIFSETFILFFIYRGIKKYTNSDYEKMLIAFVIYTLIYTPGTYYWSLNGVRQSMAAAILFFGSHYYVEDKYSKFVFVSIIATFIHYSALLGALMFILWYKMNLKRNTVYVFGVIALIASALNIPGKIFSFVIKNTLFYGVKYEGLVDNISLETSVHYGFTIVYVIAGVFIFQLYRKNFIYMFGSLYLLMRIVTCFKLADDSSISALALNTTIHRMEVYFVIFYILAAVEFLKFKKRNIKLVNYFVMLCAVLLLLSVHSIRNIENDGSNVLTRNFGDSSVGNVDYKFNFDLIE